MKKEDEIKLISIFQETFKIEDHEYIKSLKRENYLKWDSLAVVSIIASISNSFSIEIDPNDFEFFISYESIRSYIEKKIY